MKGKRRMTRAALRERLAQQQEEQAHAKAGVAKCGPRKRKEITPKQRRSYLKAFLVWVLFTAGGWISIPSHFLPLFSHCVGFGFFLMITTRKTRWLGALAIGALIFTVLLYQTIPVEAISVVTQSAGYTMLGVMLVLVSLWQVVPVEVRKEWRLKKDDIWNLGSTYLQQIMARLSGDESDCDEDGDETEDDKTSADEDSDEAKGGLLDDIPRRRSARGGALERIKRVLQGVAPENYPRIIAQLDNKLVELDRERNSMKRSFEEALKKVKVKLDVETHRRLLAEKAVSQDRAVISALRVEVKGLRSKIERSEAAELERRLRQKQEKLEQVAADKDNANHTLHLEKSTRVMIEKSLQKSEEERARLETLLKKEQASGRLTNQERTRIRKMLDNQIHLRAKAEEELRSERKRVQSVQYSFEMAQAQRSQEHKEQVESLEAQLSRALHQRAELELLAGRGLDKLSPGELLQQEEAHDRIMKDIRALYKTAIQKENERLRQHNDELQDKMLCRVCLTEQISVVLVKCGHLCLCKHCATRMKKCPLCRTDVTEVKEIYVC